MTTLSTCWPPPQSQHLCTRLHIFISVQVLNNLSSLATQFSLHYQVNSPETGVPKAERIAQIKQFLAVYKVPGSVPGTAKERAAETEVPNNAPGKPEQQMLLPTYLFCHFCQSKYLEKVCSKHLLHFDPEIILVKSWPWSRHLLNLHLVVKTY